MLCRYCCKLDVFSDHCACKGDTTVKLTRPLRKGFQTPAQAQNKNGGALLAMLTQLAVPFYTQWLKALEML